MESANCAICERNETELLFTKYGLNIVKCRQCDLTYVNPRNFRVESVDYFRRSYLSVIEENGVLKPALAHLYSQILVDLSTYLRPGRLLDAGCAMGHFMARAREDGWSVHGVECSTYAADYGRVRWGLRIQPVCDLREARLPHCHFDACVMIEVADCLPFPRLILNESFRLLKPGGLLYVTTPNFASFAALIQRERWAAILPERRLYYFTLETLTRLLKLAGFQHIVNLTAPAQLKSELERIGAEADLDIGPSNCEDIARRALAEDMSKPVNARGESLVVCGIKPFAAHGAGVASVRFSKPMPYIEGSLVCGPGSSAEDQKVYLIWQGRKHWVTSVDWLEKRGMRLNQTRQIERAALDSIISGPPL